MLPVYPGAEVSGRREDSWYARISARKKKTRREVLYALFLGVDVAVLSCVNKAFSLGRITRAKYDM